MSTLLELRVMAALLRQGRTLAAVSWLLAAAALGILFLSLGLAPTCAAAALSLLAGIVQAYYALRVGFDHALLEGIAASQGDASPEPLDAALHALGLRPASSTPRNWASRWQGMRALLRGQLLALAVQALLLLGALWLRWPA